MILQAHANDQPAFDAKVWDEWIICPNDSGDDCDGDCKICYGASIVELQSQYCPLGEI